LSWISAVGHRIVHGGDFFKNAVIISDKVIKKIEECASMAPLHASANLAGIAACKKLFPHIPQVAVFDTAFFQNMKEANFMYPLPYTLYTKLKIRKYWFHGTSHKYVYQRLTKIQKWTKKVITCHIWNGVSMTAISHGKVVETSMGFTPLEWLMMGTRSWNIDPAIVTYLMTQWKYSTQQIEDILTKKSWLLGVSEISNDMREIIAGANKGNEKAILALEMYSNSIVKYIWSYVALMNGVDAIVLTAGIMERSKTIRKMILERLTWLGISIDNKKNNFDTQEKEITTTKSKVKVRVIPTDEELQIAKETLSAIS